METARQLKAQGFSVAVINGRFAKPIDTEVLQHYARRAGLLISFEDHVLSGGYGSALLEELNRNNLLVPFIRMGWPDHFIEQGKPEALRKKYGLTVEAALERSQPHLVRMRRKELAII